MRISQHCSSSLLYLPIEEGGMGLRNLWDLYKEINIADLGEVINFHNENSLYYKTSIQRTRDLYNEGISWNQKSKISKEQYKKYWIARTIKLTKKEEITIYNNKLDFIYK
jgi:hypothetical protein